MLAYSFMFAALSASIAQLPLAKGNVHRNDEVDLGQAPPQEEKGFGAINEASFCIIAMAVAWLVFRLLWPLWQNSTGRVGKLDDDDVKEVAHVDMMDTRHFLKQSMNDEQPEPVEKPYRYTARHFNKPRSDFMCNQIGESVREGRANELLSLLERARQAAHLKGIRGVELQELCVNHLISALRACKGKACSSQVLRAYEHVKCHLGPGSSLLWSLLLGAVLDAEEPEMYNELLNNLLQCKKLYGHDFVSIVRHHIVTNDPEGLEKQIVALRDEGFSFDVVSRSRALSYCFSANAFNIARAVANDRLCGTKMDTAGYNVLMNGFLKAGEHTRCFDLHAKLLSSGLSPSDVTFGILLECCSALNDPDRAGNIFQDLRQSGLDLDEAHYGTYMKVLSNAGRFDEAIAMLDEMYTQTNNKPRRGIFAILLKAMTQQGMVMKAIDVVALMSEHGLQPEQAHFSNVLKGCCVSAMEPVEIFRVLGSLMHYGLKMSTTNLSIVLKALAMSESWSCALKVLLEAKERFDITPEPRLFKQLAWACATAGKGKKAKETYDAIIKCAHLQGDPANKEWIKQVQCAFNSSGEWQGAEQTHQQSMNAPGCASQKNWNDAEKDAKKRFPRVYIGPVPDLTATDVLKKELAKYGNVDRVLCDSRAGDGNSWALVQFVAAEEAVNFVNACGGKFKLPGWTHAARITRRVRGEVPRRLEAEMDALSGDWPGQND